MKTDHYGYDSISMDQGLVNGSVNLIDMAQDRVTWQAFVIMMINLPVP